MTDRRRPTFARLLLGVLVIAGGLVAGTLLLILSLLEVRALSAGAGVLIAVVSAAAVGGVIAVIVARLFVRRVREMRESVTATSIGHRDAPVPEDGPAELADLATVLNRWAVELDTRISRLGRDRELRDVILSAMEEGIVLFGPDGLVGYANAAARRMLQTTPEDVRTLTPHELRALVEGSRSDGQPRDREVETGLPARIIRASAVPVLKSGDVVLVIRDVTATRRVEAMRRDFVADASHELKTPAASIQAAAETVERALKDGDREAASRFAWQVRKEAVRLARIVSDLLDLSRLESERPVIEPVRLDRVVGEEVERLRRQAVEGGLGVDVESVPVTVRGSVRDLALLVRNLLENAVRYTPQAGRITVTVDQDGDLATLTVADTGIGIPTRDLPRIFERFYRVDRARSRETGGTGLGLSIARHVVEQHGGRIRARSELGRGTTFTVTLPRG